MKTNLENGASGAQSGEPPPWQDQLDRMRKEGFSPEYITWLNERLKQHQAEYQAEQNRDSPKPKPKPDSGPHWTAAPNDRPSPVS